MPKNEELNEIVREIKYKYNLTQSGIADKIGVSFKYFSNVLNGHYPFTDEMKEKIYRTFTDIEAKSENIEKTDDMMSELEQLRTRVIRLEAENDLLRELAGLGKKQEKAAL